MNDIYAYLFELDAIRKNHLSGHVYIKSQWRTVLLNWISDVHTNWHLTQETFHMTVSIIDRYLQVSYTGIGFIFRVFYAIYFKKNIVFFSFD